MHIISLPNKPEGFNINDFDQYHKIMSDPECRLPEGDYIKDLGNDTIVLTNDSIALKITNLGEGYYETHLSSLKRARGKIVKYEVSKLLEWFFKEFTDCICLLTYCNEKNRAAAYFISSLGFIFSNNYIVDGINIKVYVINK